MERGPKGKMALVAGATCPVRSSWRTGGAGWCRSLGPPQADRDGDRCVA